jgi:hypothetical protein
MQALPGMQSLSVWQGQVHFWAATLQRWVRHCASTVQPGAKGFGVESAALVVTVVAGAGSAGDVARVGAAVGPPGACVGA